MERRGILKALMAGVAGAWGARFAAPERLAAQTKHVRVYVEMDVPAERERELLDLFHNQFVPEAVKHEGYIRVKMLKRRTVLQGSVPPEHTYRFELEFENEELRKQWAASAGHQRVWPPVEKMMATTQNYPVTLYDEV